MPTAAPDTCSRIVAFLARTYRVNPQAEVPAIALERELGESPAAVRRCIESLASEGLVDADLFPVNVWVRLTDEGLAVAGENDRPEEGGRTT